MQNNAIYIFKESEKITLEILANGKDVLSFVFCYKIYLIIKIIKIIIKIIKAKFLIGESKYMCGYCKII